MPPRDHFRPPLADRRSREGFHGGWPMMIVEKLNRNLPQRYVAEPQVRLGSSIEIGVATSEEDGVGSPPAGGRGAESVSPTPPPPTTTT